MALTDSIVAYWKCDESSGNAADSVGSNTMTNNGSAAFAPGIINNGIDLESGSSQFFENTTPTAVPGAETTGGDMTVNLWYKPESQPGTNDRRVLIALWDSSDDNRCWSCTYVNLAGTTSMELLTSSNGTGGTGARINQTFNNATFYMLSWVFTAASHSVEMLVNASSIGSADTTNTSLFDTNQGAPLWFGTDNDKLQYADGILDEIGIWSRTLTGAEITELYNGGAGLQYPFGGGVAVRNDLSLLGVGT